MKYISLILLFTVSSLLGQGMIRAPGVYSTQNITTHPDVGFYIFGRAYIFSAQTGVMSISDGASGADFRLNFAGDTASFPSIKRNGANIELRRADDSARADLLAGAGTFSGIVNGSTVIGTDLLSSGIPNTQKGIIQIFDSASVFSATLSVVNLTDDRVLDAPDRSGIVSVNGVYRTITITAGAMTPRVTNGATPNTAETVTNAVMVDSLLFNGATEQGAQFSMMMPDEWDLGTVKVKFVWDAATGASASDGVTWGVAAHAKSNDDAIDVAFPASVDTDDVVLAVGDIHTTPASAAVTVGGTPALGDWVTFEITRVVGDAQDDMPEDAKLLGVVIQYKESNTEAAQW